MGSLITECEAIPLNPVPKVCNEQPVFAASPQSAMSGLCLLPGRYTCDLFSESNFNSSF